MIKAVKLADIAKELNVSVVTVSKALSGQKGVSEELRKKIKALADEMGYTPVHAAKKDKNTSYTIGVITVESYFAKFASFYWKMYQEVATRATKKNCFTMLEVISHDAENSLEPPKLLQETRVDGVIVIGRPKNAYLKMLYQHQKVPMVFLDFYDDENICDSVVSASFYGSYQMTKHLVEMGHKKIGFVGTLMATESITDRYFGYCKALMENKIPTKEEWVVPDRNIEDGIIGLEYKFRLPQNLPTAFVCNNDVTAYALIKTLENKGIRVPEDISIVGYDDYLYAEFGDSKITTYAVDMAEMSKIAIKCLIKRLESPSAEQTTHIVPGKIILRDTVKQLN